MQRISQAEFDVLAAGARTLSADEHGPKVLLTPDGRVIKLFRRKRWISSALLRPYARRFERASGLLAARDIPAVHVERVARVPTLRRDIVIYRHLPGVSLREFLQGGADGGRAMPLLARLLATLHQRGVYFRAAHFGNILVRKHSDEALDLALIDLSETRFRHDALSPALRARNFRPMTRYAEDVQSVEDYGVDMFVSAYLDAARLSSRHRARFLATLRSVHRLFDRPAAPPA